MPRRKASAEAPAPPPDEALATYREMRDFSKTPEPSGDDATSATEASRFVVQEHHATALHWDFRLERDGVLVSWAVPKGIPPDPAVNHLAVHTEDHPMEYLTFEGDIPEKEYGGGKVIVWDTGTYETHKFRDEEVMVTLKGNRVQGKYVLFKTDGKNWMMHRMDPPQDPGREPMPEAVVPMLCKPETSVPKDDANWAFEVKWDGARAIAYVQGGRIRLQSRTLHDMTKQFPEFAALGESMGSTEAVLDGEIVAFTDEGQPSFERLQGRLHLTRPNDVRRKMQSTPATYQVFDLLYLDGRSTMALPYTERRRLLEGLALEGPGWRTPDYHAGDGPAMLKASKDQGIEGVIAKRLDSPYEPGRRGSSWVKVKNFLRQEFVIAGWTPGAGRRDATLGALLLGYHDRTRAAAEAAGQPQRLIFAGKVGTGFDNRLLAKLMGQINQMRLEESPFAAGKPEPGSVFARPELVADVDFLEWTEAGTLRAPSFKGLREDKHPGDVVREIPGLEEDAPPPEVVGRVSPGGRRARREAPASKGARTAKPVGARVEVDGRELSLSNLDKNLFPSGFTKAQVIDYYTRIAPAMLLHIVGRAMTLKRYPDGSDGPFFYEKECPSHRPSWVQSAAIWSRHNEKPVNYCLVNDLPTLVWVANLASLELHPSLARAEAIERPTSVVFDLDPGPPAGILDCAEVALALRDLFAALNLQCVVKTSGSKGMQVYLPLNTPVTYDETKPFANAVARLLERQMPKRVLSSMSKPLRVGKVFVDWSQNDEHKTTVAVYSLRAREKPYVSAPISWHEVEAAIAAKSAATLAFEAPEVLERLERDGDLFAPLTTLEQSLPAI